MSSEPSHSAEVDWPEVSDSIKAMNPDLETAWRRIAWWEQTCNYWYSEAQKGYARERMVRAWQESEPSHSAKDDRKVEWAVDLGFGPCAARDEQHAREWVESYQEHPDPDDPWPILLRRTVTVSPWEPVGRSTPQGAEEDVIATPKCQSPDCTDLGRIKSERWGGYFCPAHALLGPSGKTDG